MRNSIVAALAILPAVAQGQGARLDANETSTVTVRYRFTPQ
jgi:hypothetical protein